MPRHVPREIKDRVLVDIAAHVRVYGRTRWDLVREKPEFAEFVGKAAGDSGKTRFFRWAGQVLEGVPPERGGPGRPFECGDAAQSVVDEGTKRARLAAQKNIPAAPSPAYLMRKGAEAENQINFLAVVHELMADVLKLRAMSVTPDQTAANGERIKNPHLFTQSIAQRLRVMDTALKVMQEIWDLQYQQRFYEEITGIIVEELAGFPEVQERVIRRLADLNNRRGMTLHAQPA